MAYDKNVYFAIFLTHYYFSCGVTYQRLQTTKMETYKNRDGNYRHREVPAPLHLSEKEVLQPCFTKSALKFKTAEEAVAKAKELQAQGILPNAQTFASFQGIEIKVGEVAEYGSTKSVISILQRPLSDVIGNYRAFAVTFAEEHPDFRYDNEHRYQLARSNNFVWEYMIYDHETKAISWTEDCTKATLFTRDEQDKVKEYANKVVKPFKGYIQEMNLPATHENAPKFSKGDIVKHYEDDEGHMVYDVISFGNDWLYEVECQHRWGCASYTQERFFETTPFTDLFKEEQLTLVKAG